MKTVKAPLDGVFAQAVTIFDTVRKVVSAVPSEFAEKFGEKRSGRHTIDIVITEDDEAFLRFVRTEQTVDSCFHVRQEKWVAQVSETWFQIR